MVRLDTGEVVSERRMWDEERQEDLPLEGLGDDGVPQPEDATAPNGEDSPV